jgi:hypothetical protein
MSCLYPTTERIHLLFDLFDKIKPIRSPVDKQYNCDIYYRVFQCYGYLINKLIAGWDDSECDYVFEVFEGILRLLKKY